MGAGKVAAGAGRGQLRLANQTLSATARIQIAPLARASPTNLRQMTGYLGGSLTGEDAGGAIANLEGPGRYGQKLRNGEVGYGR
jgi:hypothetical protein